MAKNTLNNFLIEDVTKLINLINEREDLQAIEAPETGFDTLADFASYWGRHIGKLSE